MPNTFFHLAFPVTDIEQTKAYYGAGLGCAIGRETDHSVILNLAGNQIVAHKTSQPTEPQGSIYPRHFGLIFEAEADWEALLERVRTRQLNFFQQPKVRFEGKPLEHRTFFLEDPFHNLLEFKFYRHKEAIFGAQEFGEVGDVEN
ncbi:MAG: VOC family protein [Blastocatellia bacterium]|nr:VOC family protein [Blastocatellia bacterium]